MCARVYPVGEVDGGRPFFSPLQLYLHLAPVLGTGVNGTNFTHDAAHRQQIKKMSPVLTADVFLYAMCKTMTFSSRSAE